MMPYQVDQLSLGPLSPVRKKKKKGKWYKNNHGGATGKTQERKKG